MIRKIAVAVGVTGVGLAGAACDHQTLTGVASNNPVAVITPSETTILPLDTVTFDGTGSYDPNPGGTISTYTWTIVSQPAGSNTSFVTTTSPAVADLFIDAGGDYTIRLTVTDNLNLTGSKDYQFSAVPHDALHIEMALGQAVYGQVDIDLHLVDLSPGHTCVQDPATGHTGDPQCMWDMTYDCHYRNCDALSGEVLDWYQQNYTADNPRLDIDGVPDTQPENINIAIPHDATYAAYVHYYSNFPSNMTGTVPVTVTVFINGQSNYVKAFNLTTPETNAYQVAKIVWSGGQGTVQPIDQMSVTAWP